MTETLHWNSTFRTPLYRSIEPIGAGLESVRIVFVHSCYGNVDAGRGRRCRLLRRASIHFQLWTRHHGRIRRLVTNILRHHMRRRELRLSLAIVNTYGPTVSRASRGIHVAPPPRTPCALQDLSLPLSKTHAQARVPGQAIWTFHRPIPCLRNALYNRVSTQFSRNHIGILLDPMGSSLAGCSVALTYRSPCAYSEAQTAPQ